MLGDAFDAPERPFAAILGGAKVSDKIGVLDSLAGKVDALIVGGGMVATFLLARGLDVGDSLVERDRVRFAGSLMERADARLMLPVDVVVADSFSEEAACATVDVESIPAGWRIMDIGPRTAEAFEEELGRCRTVVWNGPMGVFEWEPFANGTRRVGMALARLGDAVTVVGGGSTAEAVERLGIADRMTHVSTGGGASLELLEGRVLPGVAALLDVS
jgi:phosphoglycerate kinase